MANGNNVTLVGNVTRDPELRFNASGLSMATFGLAVNRRWPDRQSGEWQEATSFFDVVCWRELADNVAASIPKGSRVVVTGRMEQRSWDTENGEKRSKIEVIADEVGPSLRWATAQITKNERKQAGGPAGDGAPPAPADPGPESYADAGVGGGGYDEEPF
jgi:single-strand DNA-binding protein